MNEVVEVKRESGVKRDVFIYFFSREKSQNVIQKGEESNGGQSDAPESGGEGIWHTFFFSINKTVYPNLMEEWHYLQMQKIGVCVSGSLG